MSASSSIEWGKRRLTFSTARDASVALSFAFELLLELSPRPSCISLRNPLPRLSMRPVRGVYDADRAGEDGRDALRGTYAGEGDGLGGSEDGSGFTIGIRRIVCWDEGG